jgi:hypothetical protein
MFKSLCHLIVRTHVVLFQIIWAWFRDPLALVQSLFWGLLYRTFARLLPYWKELISIRQINQGHNGPYKYGFVQTWDALNSTWLSSFIHLNQWKLPFRCILHFPTKSYVARLSQRGLLTGRFRGMSFLQMQFEAHLLSPIWDSWTLLNYLNPQLYIHPETLQPYFAQLPPLCIRALVGLIRERGERI